jgi:hypothetical protein
MLHCVDATFNHSIYGSTPMHSLIGVIYDTNLFIKKPLPHPKSTIRIGQNCIHLRHFDNVYLLLCFSYDYLYVTYIVTYYLSLYFFMI